VGKLSSIKKVHNFNTRHTHYKDRNNVIEYSNRAVSYSNRAITVFIRQSSYKDGLSSVSDRRLLANTAASFFQFLSAQRSFQTVQ